MIAQKSVVVVEVDVDVCDGGVIVGVSAIQRGDDATAPDEELVRDHVQLNVGGYDPGGYLRRVHSGSHKQTPRRQSEILHSFIDWQFIERHHVA